MHSFRLFVTFVLLLTSGNSFSKTKVAVIMNLDNNYSKFPQDILKGILFSVEQYDKNKTIELRSFSHSGELLSIENAIKEAKVFNPSIVIAGETSQLAMIIARAFQDKIFITPTASSVKLNLVHPAPVRIIHSDEQYSNLILKLKKDLSGKKIGVIHNKSYPNTDYISKRVRELLSQNSYNFEVIEIVNDEALDELKLKTFIDKKIEVVVLFSYENDLRRVFATLSQKGINPLYIGADGWGRNEFLQKNLFKNNSSFKGVRALYWFSGQKDVSFMKIKEKLKDYIHSEPDDFHAIGHDVMKIILDTLSYKRNIKSFYETIRVVEFSGLLTTSKLKFRSDLFPLKDMYLFSVDRDGVKYKETVGLYE